MTTANENGTTGLATCARMGLRRHSAALGRGGNDHQRDEAVSLTAPDNIKAAAATVAAAFLLPNRTIALDERPCSA